jgi:hypothetical protein
MIGDPRPHIIALIEARSALRHAAFQLACSVVAADNRQDFAREIEAHRNKANDLELEINSAIARWTDKD